MKLLCLHSFIFCICILFLVGNVMQITQVLHHPLMPHQLARLHHPVILQCLLLLPVVVRLFVRKIAPCVNCFAQQEEVINSYSTLLLFLCENCILYIFISPVYHNVLNCKSFLSCKQRTALYIFTYKSPCLRQVFMEIDMNCSQ